MADILAAVDGFFEDTLGPDIYADATRLCPVFGGENSTATPESIAASPDAQPGALRDSIEYHLNGHACACCGHAASGGTIWMSGTLFVLAWVCTECSKAGNAAQSPN